MSTEFKLSTGSIDGEDFPFEITIKGDEDSDLDLIVNATKKLIENIDLKHMCDEDYDLYYYSLKQILLSVADSLECEGWEIEDDSEESKLRTIIHFLNNEGIKVN